MQFIFSLLHGFFHFYVNRVYSLFMHRCGVCSCSNSLFRTTRREKANASIYQYMFPYGFDYGKSKAKQKMHKFYVTFGT